MAPTHGLIDQALYRLGHGKRQPVADIRAIEAVGLLRGCTERGFFAPGNVYAFIGGCLQQGIVKFNPVAFGLIEHAFKKPKKIVFWRVVGPDSQDPAGLYKRFYPPHARRGVKVAVALGQKVFGCVVDIEQNGVKPAVRFFRIKARGPGKVKKIPLVKDASPVIAKAFDRLAPYPLCEPEKS